MICQSRRASVSRLGLELATRRLAVAQQRERVLLLPRGAARRAQLARPVVARLEAAPLAAGGGEAAEIAGVLQ